MKEKNPIEQISQIVLVLGICIFSAALILFNLLLGWESWTTLLLLIAGIASVVMLVIQRPAAKTRINVYACLLYCELFYFCVHSKSLYDCTPVIILIAALFAFRNELLLVILGIVTGYLGMLYHWLVAYRSEAFRFGTNQMLQLLWHIFLIFITGLLFYLFLNSVKHANQSQKARENMLRDEIKQSDFLLARLAQELLPPSLVAKAHTQMLLEKNLSGSIRRDMETLFFVQNDIADRVEEAFDYSEILRRQVTVAKEDSSLSKMLSELRMELAPHRKPDVELEISLVSYVPDILYTDMTKIKKILRHLILNSLEHTDEGGVYVHISQNLQPYGMNLSLVVEDTGIGMSEEELTLLSARFAQENLPAHSSGSLGLGISIVSGFAHALGGFVSAESTMDSGTRISVSIPLYSGENNLGSIRNTAFPNSNTANESNNSRAPLTQEAMDQRLIEDIKDLLRKEKSTGTEDPAEDASATSAPDFPDLAPLEMYGIQPAVGIHFCADDRELYLKQLLRFAEESPQKLQKLELYLANQKIRKYHVIIHSIKGTASMIGAIPLAERAAKLESAAKKNDTSYLLERMDEFKQDYERTAEGIRRICLPNATDSPEAVSESMAPSDEDSEIGFVFSPYEKEAVSLTRNDEEEEEGD